MTAGSSLLLAASLLGVVVTYGFGIVLAPVALAVVGAMIWRAGPPCAAAGSPDHTS